MTPPAIYEATFDAAVSFIIEDLEGGGEVHVDSLGYLTRWGISQAGFPQVDIANLSRDTALVLYRRYYWAALRCDELPPALAVVVFDAAIQHGAGDAARFLQRAVGVPVDGILGPRTIAAAQNASSETVLRMLTDRLWHYRLLAARKAGAAASLDGWHYRITRLAAALYKFDASFDPFEAARRLA